MPNGPGWGNQDENEFNANLKDQWNRAHWGKDMGRDSEGWGGGRYYGGPSFSGGAGTEFGQRMRLLAQQRQQPVGMSLTGMQEGLDRSTESYDQQRQALEFMKAQAAGTGPSAAGQMGVMGQEQAFQGLLKPGQPMLPNQGAGLYAAANQGAQARGQEIARGQQGLMQGAGALRGQSIQERGQNLANAAKYRDIGLSSNQQDLERELALQKLALQGYTYDQAQHSALADIQLGLQGDQMLRDQQLLNAGFNAAGQGIGAGASYFGNSPGGGDSGGPKPGGYVGSSDWGSKKGYY